jgi:hypothetical protein
MWSELYVPESLKITHPEDNGLLYHDSYTEISISEWFSWFKFNADSVQAENRFEDNEKCITLFP